MLSYPLIANKKYFVTFYVSLADSGKFACSNIGAYLSDSALVYGRHVKSYLTPQVANNPFSNPLTSKTNWMKVSGSFVAAGGEKYIVIGNFNDDAHCDTVRFPNIPNQTSQLWTHSYYYIDDVIVSPDSNYADSITAVNVVSAKEELIRVYPNPNNGKFTITQQLVKDKENLEIYNMLGEQVYTENIVSNNTEITLTDKPCGIYLYRIIAETGSPVSEGKFIIQ